MHDDDIVLDHVPEPQVEHELEDVAPAKVDHVPALQPVQVEALA